MSDDPIPLPPGNEFIYGLHGMTGDQVHEAFLRAGTPEGRAALAASHGVSVGDYSACKEDECMVCGIVACPLREPLHFHHDGCPADCDRYSPEVRSPFPTYHDMLNYMCVELGIPGSPTFEQAVAQVKRRLASSPLQK